MQGMRGLLVKSVQDYNMYTLVQCSDREGREYCNVRRGIDNTVDPVSARTDASGCFNQFDLFLQCFNSLL